MFTLSPVVIGFGSELMNRAVDINGKLSPHPISPLEMRGSAIRERIKVEILFLHIEKCHLNWFGHLTRILLPLCSFACLCLSILLNRRSKIRQLLLAAPISPN